VRLRVESQQNYNCYYFLKKLDYFETRVCAVRVWFWFGLVRFVTCVCNTSSVLFRKFTKNNSVLLSAVWSVLRFGSTFKFFFKSPNLKGNAVMDGCSHDILN
jgi:hypothetical protein